MIGTSLDLDLPSLGDPLATAITKIRAALSSLETTVADKATQAGISITGSFDLAGNAAINASYVGLVSGGVPTVAGSVYYSGNELWVKTAAGAVKITNAGNVNVTSSNGFIGDYGAPGVSAGASYHAGTGQYRMYSNSGTGVYGDVAVRSTLLQSNGFSVKLTAPAGLAASYDVTWPAAVPGTTSVVQMSAAGVLTASNTIGAMTATSLKLTGTMNASVGHDFQSTSSGVGWAAITGGALATCITATGSAWTWVSKYHPQWGLRDGDVVTSVNYRLPTTTSGTYTVKYMKQSDTTETVIDTWTFAGGSAVNASHNIASPVAIAANENHFIVISFPSTPATTDVLAYVGVGFNHP